MAGPLADQKVDKSADLLAVLLADSRELPQVDLLVDQKADLMAGLLAES